MFVKTIPRMLNQTTSMIQFPESNHLSLCYPHLTIRRPSYKFPCNKKVFISVSLARLINIRGLCEHEIYQCRNLKYLSQYSLNCNIYGP